MKIRRGCLRHSPLKSATITSINTPAAYPDSVSDKLFTGPEFVKLDNVWVVDECQGLKDVLHVLLLSAKPLGRGELGLVPDDLDALL